MNPRLVFRQLVIDLTAALSLLTRFPVTSQEKFQHHRGAWAWPVIGAGLGALAGILAAVSLAVTESPSIAAIVGLASLAVMTGCLHEDGWADSMDGLWGGSNIERRIKIMRDSHIGAYGATALVVILISKFAMISAIVASINPIIVFAVVGALSRAMMLLAIHIFPLARHEGLAATCGKPTREVTLWGGTLAILFSVLMLGWQAAIVIVLMGIVGTLFGFWVKQKIGGHTGDTLGATQQVAELAGLLMLAALH